jgi:UDP-GlcNAc3NAcA epimerase
LNLALPANLKIVKPVSFLEMMALEASARVVVTDSGGVQKEALFHRVPCVTVRGETEWTETVELGWNTLTAPEHLADRILAARPGPTLSRYPYGDGRSSEAIARILANGSPPCAPERAPV